MKQHITVKQLNELSDKSKKKLHKYFYDNVIDLLPVKVVDCDKQEGFVLSVDDHKDADFVYLEFEYSSNHIKVGGIRYRNSCVLPLLSIGQMIEFLKNSKELWTDDWGSLVLPSECLENKKKILCDDLWQAVKEVLEND